MAFIGEPNTIRRIFIPNNRGGYWIMAKYGDDGWAVKFRHETDHGFSKKHTSPHDHIPAYDPHTHAPDWDNTLEINYPNGAPEFKAPRLRFWRGYGIVTFAGSEGWAFEEMSGRIRLRLKCLSLIRPFLISGRKK